MIDGSGSRLLLNLPTESPTPSPTPNPIDSCDHDDPSKTRCYNSAECNNGHCFEPGEGRGSLSDGQECDENCICWCR